LSEPAEKEGRRRYDSPVRRERAAATRARIVAAGAEILHGYPIWNWGALTVRAVAQRAGVNERTVYRYFATERALRDAVMTQLEGEAGVDLEGLTLDGLQKFTSQILEFVSSFPLDPRTPDDPTLVSTGERQREALLAAVAPSTEHWSDRDRAIAAAMFDVLWSIATYERLVADWELDSTDAIRGVTWAIQLVQDAIARGEGPGTERGAT
jgi:AcrR family transcriptional regulator